MCSRTRHSKTDIGTVSLAAPAVIHQTYEESQELNIIQTAHNNKDIVQSDIYAVSSKHWKVRRQSDSTETIENDTYDKYGM